MNVSIQTPTKPLYTVVVQFHSKRTRAYLSCEDMKTVRETIRRHKLIKDVKFIYYKMRDCEYIVAYDSRDPTRYV